MMNAFLARAAAVALLWCGVASAQAPLPALRILVPTGTGGTADVLARHIAMRLQAGSGRAVIVENRTGAGGNIGAEAVAKSAPDGSTVGLLSNAMVVAQALGAKPRFDVEKDFTPIMLLGETPMALVAHPRLGLKNMADLLAYAKSNPAAVSYASCGIGTPHHLVMELVKQNSGLDAKHVAYRGCSPALADVLGDQVPLAMLSANLAVPHARSGKLNVLAVTSKEPYAPLPAVAPLEQQGFKSIAVTNWFALMGPAGLRKADVDRLQAEVGRILQEPATKSAMADAGVEIQVGNAQELARAIASDRARYEQIATSAKIKLE